MTITFDIMSTTDFNTRVVSLLLDKWKRVDSDIYVSIGGEERRVMGMSKLGLLSLCTKKDDILHFMLNGEDSILLMRDKDVIVKSFVELRTEVI